MSRRDGAVTSGLVAALLLTTRFALASEAPDVSLHPVPRPEPEVVAMAAIIPDIIPAIVQSDKPGVVSGHESGHEPSEVSVPNAPLTESTLPAVRPLVRPPSPQVIAVAARAATDPVFSPTDSLRPTLRPDEIVQQALFGKRKKRKGSVCGDIDIQGDKIGNYGKGGGCFISDAVRVRSVSGVALSPSALMTCDTAKALNTWIDKGVQPAFGNKVVEIRVAAHYACRTRNNRAGAKLSEHAKGRAIDISAFRLKNGNRVTVLNDWGRGKYGGALSKSRATACGIFGTVLGPGSDGYHRDHFHMDTARYRSGAYCR